MEGYIEELRRRKAEGRYPLDAYEEEEVAEADALAVKIETFKEGDLVYMPGLGDRPGRNRRLILVYRDRTTGVDMALLEQAFGFSSSYPLRYVEPEPPPRPVNGVLLVIFILVPVLVICGFLYHSM